MRLMKHIVKLERETFFDLDDVINLGNEVGNPFGISLDATFRLLFGDEVVAWLGFVGIKGTYDTGYDIEIHGITSHPKKLSFCFGPFPQFRSHTLGTQGFMAPHSPTSFQEPVAVGSGGEETWDRNP